MYTGLSSCKLTHSVTMGAANSQRIAETNTRLNNPGYGEGDLPRPLEHLRLFSRTYPKAWSAVDRARSGGGSALTEWPEWCFLPVARAYDIVSGGPPLRNFNKLKEVAKLAAFAAWRATQGVYRFDPTVFEELWDTPVGGDLPAEVLLRLPEWCVYIETPDRNFGPFRLHGFFAHLEYDAVLGRSELHLLLDTVESLYLVPLHLRGDLRNAINLAWEQAQSNRRAFLNQSGTAATRESAKQPRLEFDVTSAVTPLISLVLYLCSGAAELRDRKRTERQPSRPAPTKTKQGERHFPPEQTTLWEVAYRLGATLRAAGSITSRTAVDGVHASPRPHIRRAHWHSFWTGPRRLEQPREVVVKWLPPVPVNAESSDQLVPVIHQLSSRKTKRSHSHV